MSVTICAHSSRQPRRGRSITITWYSTDRKLATVARGGASKAEALQIIDGYFARLKPHYESGEEALAETMFGFQKSPEEFVELCINSPTEISCRYQTVEPRKILFLNLPKIIRSERTLTSKEAAKNEVSLFYDLEAVAFRSHAGAWLSSS